MKIFEISYYLPPQLRVTDPRRFLTFVEPSRGQDLLRCVSFLGIFSEHADQKFLALGAAFVPYGTLMGGEILENYRGWRRIFYRIYFQFRPENGGAPESMTQRMTPTDQTSHFQSYFPLMTSGATQQGVPARAENFSPLLNLTDVPKSIILSRPLQLSQSMFSGLRSRCMIPFLCMQNTADIICLKSAAAEVSVKMRLALMKAKRSPPSQSSMMRARVPLYSKT